MAYLSFTIDEADAILRASEGRPTSYRADAERGPASGHAAAAHFLLSNAELIARYWKEHYRENSADFLMITAFTGQPARQIATAAAEVLNTRQAQRALATFFGPGGENGMRAEIHCTGTQPYRMRYVCASGQAVQTMPTTDLVMVLDRHDGRPDRLHIQTFFGTAPYVPRNAATIKSRTGKLLFSHLG